MKHWFSAVLMVFSTLCLATAIAAPERVAILGDSITYDGRWATRVESALRGTPSFADAEIVNFGLGSETVSGLSEEGHAGGKFPRPCLHERLGRILEAFKPTLVLACYGMNDGIVKPLDEGRMAAFRSGMEKLKAEVEAANARLVLITAPLHKGDKPSEDPQRYDAVLDAQAAWLVSKRADGWTVLDIRPELKRRVGEAKAANPAFVYAADDVHPGDEGHRFIADAICQLLWPTLRLPGRPAFANDDALKILKKRNDILKLAWLSKTRHQRPGIPAGLPLDEANAKAVELMNAYRDTAAPKNTMWNGYEKTDFQHNGRAALLVKPKSPAPGMPWIWRTEFFGHQPQGDIGLLDKGFHVAYIDMQNLYGAPVAMAVMDGFHAHLTKTVGLSQKVILEGFSRGGLYAFNWAALRPGFVAGLYVDAPVCDFRSWPGGKGKGPGSAADWQRLLNVYEFTEAQALAYDKNPVDNLAPLAKAGVPILAVIGDADEVVPTGENIDIVEKRYKALGGNIRSSVSPVANITPHSLPDPKPIVDFAVKAVSP